MHAPFEEYTVSHELVGGKLSAWLPSIILFNSPVFVKDMLKPSGPITYIRIPVVEGKFK